MKKKVLAVLLVSAALLWAVDVIGNLNVVGTLTANVVDFTASTSTAPMRTGAALPGTCAVGQTFFNTASTAGQNIHLCTATNTWTQVTGGGAGAFDWRPNTRYVSRLAEFLGVANVATWTEAGYHFTRPVGSVNLSAATGGGNRVQDLLGLAGNSTTSTSGNQTRYQTFLSAFGFDAAGNGFYANTNRPWEIQWRMRYPVATDFALSTMHVGLSTNSNTGANARGVGVRFIAGTDTNLMFYVSTSDGTWGPLVSTGVAPDTVWRTVRIRSHGTNVNHMFIRLDAGTERSICPTGCDMALAAGEDVQLTSWQWSILTSETSAKRHQLDYLYTWYDLGFTR